MYVCTMTCESRILARVVRLKIKNPERPCTDIAEPAPGRTQRRSSFPTSGPERESKMDARGPAVALAALSLSGNQI